MRPLLTKKIRIDDFKEYYWLKKELQLFCREHNLSSGGSKVELANRIEAFLLTGVREKPVRKKKPAVKAETYLHLETIITENHRCSQNVRTFFQSVIGQQFHFSVSIQNFFKNNAGKTYQDAVNFWYEEKERSKKPDYQTKIGPQFEYNQFIRDFFADIHNKGKTQKEAIAAWKEIKSLPGNNKYVSKNEGITR